MSQRIELNSPFRSLRIKPIWADSLGAKSFCTLVKTPNARILIDPGVAIMHATFPAPWDLKIKWVEEGYEAVIEASLEADVVIITHYHYDHFTDFDDRLYKGKLIIAKSPNRYINDSQRNRAISFYTNLFRIAKLELRKRMERPLTEEYPDPLDELLHAMSISYGAYEDRRRELLEKGMKWFMNRVNKWNSYKRIPELKCETFELKFADGKEFKFGDTYLRFTSPMFHGVEFSRVGWVIGVTIEYRGEKLLYSSDLNGPIIEDYADWIIREKPDYVFLDGPATYTLGYMLNMTNLRRAINNISRIITDAHPKLILLDHHLPREAKFKERLREVYEIAERENVNVLTVAEYLGKVPVVLRKFV